MGWRLPLLAVAAFAATLHLWSIPLDYYDQALFRLAAATVRAGGYLYRDYWDIKAPGIFSFYVVGSWLDAAAQTLATWIRPDLIAWLVTRAAPPQPALVPSPAVASGVHLLGSLWFTATALVAAWIGWQVAPRRALWFWLSLLSTLPYLLRADVMSVFQVESLVPLPILLTLALLLAASPSSSGLPAGRRSLWCFAAAGLCTAWVAAFKIVLCAVPCMFVLLAAVGAGIRAGADRASDRRPGNGPAQALRCVAAASGGFALGLAAICLPFLLHQTFPALVHTQFDWAAQALQFAEPATLSRLKASFLRFASTASWLLPAAAYGLWHGVAVRRLDNRQGLLQACLLSWLLLGPLLFLMQRFSWWAYHVVVLWWPLGLLAGLGLYTARVRSASTRALPFVLLLATVTAGIAVELWRLQRPEPHFEGRSPDSTHYLEQMPLLRQRLVDAPCRSSFIFANATLVFGSGTAPAAPLSGDHVSVLIEPQWQELESLLRSRLPRFVARFPEHDRFIAMHSPSLLAWLDTHYRHIESDADGTRWFELADETAPPHPPCIWTLTPGAAEGNARVIHPG